MILYVIKQRISNHISNPNNKTLVYCSRTLCEFNKNYQYTKIKYI